MLNTFEKGFDLGIISFLLVIIFQLLSPKKTNYWFLFGSFLFVSLNYLLGVFGYKSHNKKITFLFYCLIFTLLWLFRALFLFYKIKKKQN